jgi:hypothetical protein
VRAITGFIAIDAKSYCGFDISVDVARRLQPSVSWRLAALG